MEHLEDEEDSCCAGCVDCFLTRPPKAESHKVNVTPTIFKEYVWKASNEGAKIKNRCSSKRISMCGSPSKKDGVRF